MKNTLRNKQPTEGQRKQKLGFTLVELLIVIAIIGLLASMVMVFMNDARKKARDAQRKANLRQVQTALELYYSEYLQYPSTGSTATGSPQWRAEAGTWGSYPLYSSDAYIPGISPRFISLLPHDSSSGSPNQILSACSAGTAYYVYASNGRDYKFIANCLNESIPDPSDNFYDPIRPTWSFQVSSPGGRNW